jgi:hypothetical protein
MEAIEKLAKTKSGGAGYPTACKAASRVAASTTKIAICRAVARSKRIGSLLASGGAEAIAFSDFFQSWEPEGPRRYKTFTLSCQQQDENRHSDGHN